MVVPGVGVEAGEWSGQLTEQPGVDEQPEVSVDGAQAHPGRSADDPSVDFLGRGMRLDTPDHLEHRAARNGQAESSGPQRDIRTLGTRWARIVRYPSSWHLRDDSHSHQLPRTNVTVRALAPRVKQRCDAIVAQCSTRVSSIGGKVVSVDEVGEDTATFPLRPKSSWACTRRRSRWLADGRIPESDI